MKLRRWDTNEVIFELECSTWEELLKGALKAKISFFRADFRGSDFRGSNFRGINFRGINFRDSNFRDSNFRGSRHQYKIGNMKEWRSMQIDTYMIVFNRKILAIGCHQHTLEAWKNFTDDDIANIDTNALEWWKKWNDFIFKAIRLSYGEAK